MKSPIVITAAMALAFAGSIHAGNEINGGYLRRAGAMLADDNYQGCLDQLTLLQSLPATPSNHSEILWLTALASVRSGASDASEAIERLLAADPASPHRADVLALRADLIFDQGLWADALAAYAAVDTGALTGPGTREGVTFHTSYAYMMLGEPAKATEGFTSLLGSKMWGQASQFYLGYLAYAAKDYTRALELLGRADTSVAPGNAAPYYIAQIEFARGNYQASLDAARKLLESGTVKDYIPECNRLAGESLYNLGQTSEAVPYLWNYCAGSRTPQPSAYYILGADEYAKGNNDEAIKLLQQATSSPSAMGQSAWLYLGQAYMKRGDSTSALIAFEKAYRMDLDPKVREEAFYNYAVVRMEGGRVPFGNSVAMLEEFLRDYPNSVYAPKVERYIVDGYMTDGDYESALAAIGRAKTLTPAMKEARQRALFVLGTRAYAAGRTAEAVTRLTEARAIAANASVTRQCSLWLGDALYARGNYDAAADAYRAYLASRGNDTEGDMLARYGLAYTEFAREEWSAAAAEFGKAASLASKLPGQTSSRLLPDIYCRIGDCLYYQGDYARALDDYTHAVELDRQAADYPTFQSAMMKGLLKDHKGKIALLNRLMADYPSSGLVPQALLEKAESLGALGEGKKAIDTYAELVRLYPASAPGRNGYLQLAIAYINGGERQKGIDTYRQVITSYPTSEEARIAADDLKQLYAADGRLQEFVGFISSVPGAPAYEPSELEAAAFQAAENAYITSGATQGLTAYVREWPAGASRAQALNYLADAAWTAGDARHARELASQVLREYPHAEVAEDALLVKARAESELGLTKPAYESYVELESTASGSNMLREARIGIVRTASDLGLYDKAVAAADKVLSSTASSSAADTQEVRFLRAMALKQLGRTREAYADWEALEHDMRDLYGAKSAYYHAQALFDAGQTDNARKLTDALISSDTPQSYWLARGFILYSDILRRQGNTFEADEYLKSLRSNYPGTEADIFEMISTRLK